MPDTNVWLALAVAAYGIVAVGLVLYVLGVRRASLFDPLLQCVVFISLFTLPLPLRALTSDIIEGDVTEHLPQLKPFLAISVVYAAVGLICLAVAYYSRVAVALGRAFPHPPVVRRPRVYSTTLLLGAFSLFLLAVLAREVGGLVAFVLLGYNSSAETFGRGYLAIGFPWLFVAGMFPLYRYALLRRRTDLFVAGAFMVGLAAVQLLLGNRSVVMYMGLTIAFFVHYAVRPLPARVLIPLAFAGFVFLNIVGFLRGSKYQSFSDLVTRSAAAVGGLQQSNDLDHRWFYTLTTGEFVVPFETLPEMVRSVGTRVPPTLGTTFLRAPLFMVPSVIYPDRPLPLTNWYMAKFYGSGFGLNEGRAFFFMSEGYLNFGPAGIILLLFAWGAFWGAVREYVRLANGNPGSALLAALSVAFIFRAVAGDFVSLLIGLPEQSLSCAVIGLALMTGFGAWYRYRPQAGTAAA